VCENLIINPDDCNPTEDQIALGLLTKFFIIVTIFVIILTIFVIFMTIKIRIERQSETFLPDNLLQNSTLAM